MRSPDPPVWTWPDHEAMYAQVAFFHMSFYCWAEVHWHFLQEPNLQLQHWPVTLRWKGKEGDGLRTASTRSLFFSDHLRLSCQVALGLYGSWSSILGTQASSACVGVRVGGVWTSSMFEGPQMPHWPISLTLRGPCALALGFLHGWIRAVVPVLTQGAFIVTIRAHAVTQVKCQRGWGKLHKASNTTTSDWCLHHLKSCFHILLVFKVVWLPSVPKNTIYYLFKNRFPEVTANPNIDTESYWKLCGKGSLGSCKIITGLVCCKAETYNVIDSLPGK